MKNMVVRVICGLFLFCVYGSVLAAPGDDCLDPIVIAQSSLPYSATGASSCGALNNYSDTCLGGYDDGEDIVYQITLTDTTGLTVYLDPKSSDWVGILLDDSCPPDPATCLASLKNGSSTDPMTLACMDLDPGTYYVMVDTYPSPYCIPDFDIMISECTYYTPTPTPTIAPGDTCGNPVIVGYGDLPFSDTNTNCGRLNTQENTCLDSYDKGEDIFYEITLPVNTGITVTLDPKGTTYAGFLIDDSCPPDAGTCIASFTNGSAGTSFSSGNVDLIAGTYYIMIDTFAEPDCIPDFDLTIFESSAPTPTPTYTPAGEGGNCGWPIVINQSSLPFSDSAQTTCGMFNSYEDTCLEGYDGGEDIIYQLTITDATGLTIALDPHDSAWTAVVVDDSCPPDVSNCIITASNLSAAPYSTGCFDLEPGVYYIMVDTYPDPTCITTFDLNITTCTVPTPTATPTPIDCTGTLPEGEETCYNDFEDTTNIGCGTGTMWSVFTRIGCGESICGTAGNFDYYGDDSRDTDWFEYDVPIQTNVSLTLRPAFDADFFIGDYNDCFNQVDFDYAHVPAGTSETLTINLPPGTYHAFVAPDSFIGTACGSQYRLDLMCDNVTPTPIPATPTAFPFCDTGHSYSNATGGAIPDNACGSNPLQSVITVSESFPVTGVTLKLSINHPHVTDLDALLRGPDGTEVILFTDVGGGGDNFTDTVFTDTSLISIEDGTAPFPYAYHPEENLASFVGKSSSGDWTLEICDDASSDLGNLVQWELCLEGEDLPAVPSVSVIGLFFMLILISGFVMRRQLNHSSRD